MVYGMQPWDQPTRVKFVTEELQKCILLEQYDNMDGTFDVYIAGVAKDSAASEVRH